MLGFITDPTAPGGLARRELPEPQPQPNEALVQVAAFSVNRGELSLLEQRSEGWAPGQDLAGTVVAESADGTGPAIGTRVLAIADQGSWSERVAVPTHRIGRLPDGVDLGQAAGVAIAGLTALRALRLGGALLGANVLVTGASGGVGHLAVQLARIGGARTTGLVSGPDRVAAVERLGVDAVVSTLAHAESEAEERPAFDLVIECVGGQVLVDALHRTARNGTVALLGIVTREPAPLTLIDLSYGRFCKLQGFFLYDTDESTFGRDLEVLGGFLADGRLQVDASTSGSWDDTVELVDELRRRTVTGKVVVTIS